MIATLPTGRAGSVLALGLLGSALLISWFAGAAPLLRWHEEQATALAQRRLLSQRMEAFVTVLPALQRAASAPVLEGVDATLLQGGTDAIAGAALQALVRDMAGRIGATLVSVETLPTVANGPYRRIGLRLTLNAQWPMVVQLLQVIDKARPRLVIDDLELHQTHLQLSEQEVLLSAAFTLYGFRGDAELRRAP
jgi:general secretion pathway protein M